MSLFVLVEGVAMSSVLLIKLAVCGYLPTQPQSQIVTDSRVPPQDLCDKVPRLAATDTEPRLLASSVIAR